MSEAVIQTQELTKHYRHPFFTWVVRARALSGLDLEVQRGEVFGLLGPNGSGKSTTIKLLLGLIFPTSGRVAVFGSEPRRLENRARIGYLPEESTLYRTLDAEETLDYYGRLFNLDRRERKSRVESLLDLVGLREQRHRPVAQFSKGMKRRVGLAQCLINDPELVILDEPTTGMDPIGTAEIKDLVRQLKSQGKTVLLCSHLLSEVEDVCDRVTILYGGRQQLTGTVDELVSHDRAVQITGELDPATIEAIQALVRERLGDKAALTVRPARERLEDVFLRTIAEARGANQATSGAGATTRADQVAFLGGGRPAASGAPAPAGDATPKPNAVLAGLSTPAAPSSPAPESEPEPVAAGAPNQAVLDGLSGGTAGDSAPAAPETPAAEAAEAPPKPNAVLEGLAGEARPSSAAEPAEPEPKADEEPEPKAAARAEPKAPAPSTPDESGTDAAKDQSSASAPSPKPAAPEPAAPEPAAPEPAAPESAAPESAAPEPAAPAPNNALLDKLVRGEEG